MSIATSRTFISILSCVVSLAVQECTWQRRAIANYLIFISYVLFASPCTSMSWLRCPHGRRVDTSDTTFCEMLSGRHTCVDQWLAGHVEPVWCLYASGLITHAVCASSGNPVGDMHASSRSRSVREFVWENPTVRLASKYCWMQSVVSKQVTKTQPLSPRRIQQTANCRSVERGIVCLLQTKRRRLLYRRRHCDFRWRRVFCTSISFHEHRCTCIRSTCFSLLDIISTLSQLVIGADTLSV